MAIVDRVKRKGDDDPSQDISSVVLFDAFALVCNGELAAATVVTQLNLDGTESSQLAGMQTDYNNAANKALYLIKIQTALNAYENQILNKTRLSELLGIS